MGDESMSAPPSEDASPARPTGPNPPFSKAVGFVLSQLGLVVARQFSQAIASTGLHPREFALLQAIAASQGITQNAVSDQLAIPPSTLVTLIDHLESLGVLERRTHPLDRRSRTLYVTDEGNSTLRAAMQLAMEYEEHLCGDLTSTERNDLLERLGRIATRLEITPGVHPGMSIDAPCATEATSTEQPRRPA
ncbi:MAG TPA: MarR family winged helix-turn-helix transcriptional regulator [Acidimicrobiales bacterium]|jgi:DNA-binding MarR family transcriptional regulator|nr:MarR family winged helix-turn-helix transcriptional regulator [Acidimicrobiales bacterium]